jgi:glycosyltransferase involved in cell wall biosynthesis
LRPSVILLTFNSEASLGQTLASLEGLTDDIHIVDSGSTDGTLAIAEAAGAHILNHPFKNYGDQRNWAIDNTATRYPWQLHLDADERLSPELRAEIFALPAEGPTAGYFLPRLLQFLGRILRHGGMNPTWHMRLFRKGEGRCETREYDQHFRCSGLTATLRNVMIDDVRMPLTEWTARHNRWADAEVRELLRGETEGRVQGRWSGNAVERRRALRSVYERVPLFVRPFGLYFYRMVLCLGFLDGPEGFIFYTLQTFWFRFLVDAKLWEARHASHTTVASR